MPGARSTSNGPELGALPLKQWPKSMEEISDIFNRHHGSEAHNKRKSIQIEMIDELMKQGLGLNISEDYFQHLFHKCMWASLYVDLCDPNKPQFPFQFTGVKIDHDNPSKIYIRLVPWRLAVILHEGVNNAKKKIKPKEILGHCLFLMNATARAHSQDKASEERERKLEMEHEGCKGRRRYLERRLMAAEAEVARLSKELREAMTSIRGFEGNP